MSESVTADHTGTESFGKSDLVTLAFDAADYAAWARSPATVAAYEHSVQTPLDADGSPIAAEVFVPTPGEPSDWFA